MIHVDYDEIGSVLKSVRNYCVEGFSQMTEQATSELLKGEHVHYKIVGNLTDSVEIS